MVVCFADASGAELVEYICTEETPTLMQLLSIMREDDTRRVNWRMVPGLACVLQCHTAKMEGLTALASLVELPEDLPLPVLEGAATEASTTPGGTSTACDLEAGATVAQQPAATPPATTPPPAQRKASAAEVATPATPEGSSAAAKEEELAQTMMQRTETAVRLGILANEWQEVRVAVLVGLRPLLAHCISTERSLVARKGNKRLIQAAKDTQEVVMKQMRDIDSEAPRSEDRVLSEQRTALAKLRPADAAAIAPHLVSAQPRSPERRKQAPRARQAPAHHNPGGAVPPRTPSSAEAAAADAARGRGEAPRQALRNRAGVVQSLRGAVALSPASANEDRSPSRERRASAGVVAKGGRRVASVGSPARRRSTAVPADQAVPADGAAAAAAPAPAAAESPLSAAPRRAHTPQPPTAAGKHREKGVAKPAAAAAAPYVPSLKQREKLNLQEQLEVVDRLYTRRVHKVALPAKEESSSPRWMR